jgi:hypothetical protein
MRLVPRRCCEEAGDIKGWRQYAGAPMSGGKMNVRLVDVYVADSSLKMRPVIIHGIEKGHIMFSFIQPDIYLSSITL